ncbi:hypothetical protein PLANPX_2658 [Lacipirellula parvula]|uniref:Uncharacterized protein n=1 Tax=Lacipirellula parvula TaxID=2650471 RepID=A0A5K7XFD2_9BACT|nr:hypothetical protein PLANPX_2658 [Lacipirellula parvula]
MDEVLARGAFASSTGGAGGFYSFWSLRFFESLLIESAGDQRTG